MLWLDAQNTLINTATLTMVEPDKREGEGARHGWIARFIDGSTKRFRATPAELTDLSAKIVTAPPGFVILEILEDNEICCADVIAFSVFGSGDYYQPIPYTVQGRRDLSHTCGLLGPSGSVVTCYGLYPNREAFVKAAFESLNRGASSEAAA